MKATVSIRAARPADAAAMADCVAAAYGHYVERIGTPPGPMLDDYRAVARSPLAFVLEVDGVLAGIAVLQASEAGLLLDNIAVHPDYAGRGYGRSLMAFVEQQAITRGYPALDLYTHELMHENIAMYTAMGYVEVERRVERGFARVYMRRLL